ncbi:MAG TPA: hypothetical protein VN495_03025 [Candidatus Paceibacterota bacterium]|nr:hypothetical protein [Candidatus Paceibacterota bacterium]
MANELIPHGDAAYLDASARSGSRRGGVVLMSAPVHIKPAKYHVGISPSAAVIVLGVLGLIGFCGHVALHELKPVAQQYVAAHERIQVYAIDHNQFKGD